MIERYIAWLDEWNGAQENSSDERLHEIMNKLEDVLSQIIGECESEGTQCQSLKGMLVTLRAYKNRHIERRMDVAEKIDWNVKGLMKERLERHAGLEPAVETQESAKPDRTKPDHAVTVYYKKYYKKKPYPVAVDRYLFINSLPESQRSKLLQDLRNDLKKPRNAEYRPE